jgi:type I restriction enzyme S subunit
VTWQTRRLGDVLELRYGKSLPARKRTSGEVPVYGSGGIDGHNELALIKGPGVIVGRKGSVGSVFYEARDFFPIDTVYYVWPKNDAIDFRFAYYLLKNLPLASLNTDAAVPGLNRERALSIAVRLPDQRGQETILSILSAYDDLIENNRRRITLLEEAVRMLYREWFVYLRFPGHEHVKIIDGRPKGWERKKISEIAEVFRGKSYSSQELVDEDGQPFVNLKCIQRFGGFRISGLKGFRGEHKDHHLLASGDIVVAVTDMTRESMIVAQAARIPRAVSTDAIFSMDLVKVVPKTGIDPNWLYGMLRFSRFSAEVREEATGATVLHLKPKHIESWTATVPGELLRALFSEQFGTILDQIDNLEVQCGKLAQARDLLLPRLMNGEIAV